MENKLTEKIKIQPSDVDCNDYLSYPDIFALFQNIAVDQSEMLGYDQSVLTPKGLFWVTSKCKVKINERPKQGEYIDLSTWPEKPDRIRGRRNYTFEKDGKRLIEATSEWAIIDRNANRLYMINKLYDESFEFCPEKVLTDPFTRFTTAFTGEPFAEYTVRSIDIDFEGHMNNVAYIRALIGLFSRKELEELDPKFIEVQYKTSCYEGDKLLWYRAETDEGVELCAKLGDGTEIFFAKLCR